MWFETLTGFCEESPQQVRKNISINGSTLTSHVNGRTFSYGTLEIVSLKDLRKQLLLSDVPEGKLSVREIIKNVQELHIDKSNNGALFQVASQFNLLEMMSPAVTPEFGVGRYEYDPTQGPACAVAAGSGTIYRNYFAQVNGKTGQSADHQIDCLAGIGEALGNSDHHLWEMKNGYALASEKGLIEINNRLKSSSEKEIDELRQLLHVGIQWNTEVTIADSQQFVSQIYCSALPVAYSNHLPQLWAEFALLVLEASYEASLCAGLLNSIRNGNKKLYLTLIGGGAFGNEIEWIINAIQRALNLFKHYDLDVIIVSYSCSNTHIQKLVSQFSK